MNSLVERIEQELARERPDIDIALTIAKRLHFVIRDIELAATRLVSSLRLEDARSREVTASAA